MHQYLSKTFSLFIIAASLAGCGGGGASGSSQSADTSTSTTHAVALAQPIAVPPPTTTISGVFDGSVDASQPVTSILQNDGSFYLVYSDATSSQFTGVILGVGSLRNGSFTSSNGLNLSLTGSGAQPADPTTLSASYTQRQSFNGNVSYSAGNRSFTGTYNSAYETLPTLPALAGSYTGTLTTKDQREAGIVLTVAADGTLSGKLSCGCSITSQLFASADGTHYDATLAFNGGSHPLTGKSLAGNVYLDVSKRRLYIVGNLSGTTDKVIFVGTKP